MKLFIYHARAEEYGRAVAARFPDLEIIMGQDAATLERGLAEAEIIMASRVPTAELGRAKRLRWIALTSAGVDHLVPIRDQLQHVTVTNASGIHGVLVADYVFGVLVMLQWGFPKLLKKQAAREWSFQFTEPLAGKTLGLLGLGAIGSAVARRASAFDMRVIGLRRHPAPVAGVDEVLGPRDLPRLLEESDVVVVMVPRTGETQGLIGETELRRMRKSAFLINVARGAVVAEPALLRALRERWIAGAALDVFAQEPLPATSPFWDLDNVIVTPHIAGEPLGYTERMVRDVFADNLIRYRAGQPLQNVVDLDIGY